MTAGAISASQGAAARAAVAEAARDALAAGLSVVPPAEDGTKRPLTAWRLY